MKKMLDLIKTNIREIKYSFFVSIASLLLSLLLLYSIDKNYIREAKLKLYYPVKVSTLIDNYSSEVMYELYLKSKNSIKKLKYDDFKNSFSIIMGENYLTIKSYAHSMEDSVEIVDAIKLQVIKDIENFKTININVIKESNKAIDFVKESEISREAYYFYVNKVYDFKKWELSKHYQVYDVKYKKFNHVKNISLSILISFLVLFLHIFYFLEIRNEKE